MTLPKLQSFAIVSMFAFCSCASSGVTASSEPDVDNDLDFCDRHVRASLNDLKNEAGYIDYSMMPRNIAAGDTTWHCRKSSPEEWCSGFWPGVLWYAYEATGDSALLTEADRFTLRLDTIINSRPYDHDIGFLIQCSYGNGYRLTRKPEYKEALVNAADSLATLFNPKAGTLLSWPRNIDMFGGHNTIIDNMINLELLFHAAAEADRPYLYDIAVKHAETTMKHHFRPDYTSYHVAVYDPESGEFLRGCTHQGVADDSMWARGQAWAIYGYTMVYRETGDTKFLDFAQKVTDVYLDRLPEDKIPYWDFNGPSIPETPRDASAAAIVASALIELSTMVDGEKSVTYLDSAKKMLMSLASDSYRAPDNVPSFLMHSVGNMPAGSEIDYSIIYADYYYIEALNRLKKLKSRFDNKSPLLS